MADFTPTQGRYLAYIHAYTSLHGCPPAESEIASAMMVSPPSVNQMVKMLEKRGLISRRPGEARSLQVIIPEDEIPPWDNRKPAQNSKSKAAVRRPLAPSANLYVFSVFLMGGPISEKYTGKRIERVVEIRGDQTLADLHEIVFKAYDRWDEHLYEFQLGKRPYDPRGPNYCIPDGPPSEREPRDAAATTIDSLKLQSGRVFGYWFDFGDDWYHQVRLVRIEQAIPTVKYPRIIRRVGKSPPQYQDE